MNRPSHYLLICVLLFVGYFALTGHLVVKPDNRAPEPRAERVVAREVRPSKPRPLSVLEGMVLDALGYRVVGAEIALHGRDEKARTDADGRFRFDLEASGPVRCDVAAAGFRPAGLDVHPAVGGQVVFALEPTAPWDQPGPVADPARSDFAGEGFVRDRDGRPVSGALVTVAETGAQARTDEIGRYRISLPGEGEATMVVHQPAGDGLCARSEPLQFDRRRGLLPLPELVAERGAVIRGILRDPKGQPLAGMPLLLRGEGLQRCMLSGADGVFRIAGLIAGRYELLAYAWRGAVAAAQQVEVATPFVDCELQLQMTESRRMHVVDESGKPVPFAYVASSFAGQRRGVAQTDGEGRCEVPAAREPKTAYEVRTGDDHRELPVRKVGHDGVLVVAAP